MEEEETRRRLALETERWRRQELAKGRKEAEQRDEVAKREAREKVGGYTDATMDVVLGETAGGGGRAGEGERGGGKLGEGRRGGVWGGGVEAGGGEEERWAGKGE